MDSDNWRSIALLAVFMVLKAFYTLCEYSVNNVNTAKLKPRTDKKSAKNAQNLIALTDAPENMNLAFAVWRAVSSSVIFICAAAVFFEPLSRELRYLRFIGGAADFFALAVIVLAAVLAVVVLTEMLPEYIGAGVKAFFAPRCVPAVKILIFILIVPAKLAEFLTVLLCKVFGISAEKTKDTDAEEEILMLLGEDDGSIEESSRDMISNIFEFGDALVSSVMTHRKDICAVDIKSNITELSKCAVNEGFSRIPVYKNSVDNIVGMICVKDLLCLVGCTDTVEFTVSKFLRDVIYVPETNKCQSVFETMTKKKTQFAIVLDEYGGTAGIVTMEDLLEEIVGNIQDEYDDEEAEFLEISDGVYMVDGSADPEEIFENLGIKLPEEHNYDTMGAFFVDILGEIPTDGEHVSVKYKNTEMTAAVTEGNWVKKIKLTVEPPELPAEK